MVCQRLFQIIIPVIYVLLPKTSASIKADIHDDQKYKVLRMIPEDMNQLAAIKELYEQSTKLQLDFWRAPTGVGQFVDIMTKPAMTSILINRLIQKNLTFTITINDVQKLILEREGDSRNSLPEEGKIHSSVLDSFLKRWKDMSESRNKAKYGFGEYHPYNDILSWLSDIEYFYPQMAQVFTIGITYEGRHIKGIKIGNPIGRTDKRIVWIDGGMHAREWAAIHTALYFIDQLISQYGVDPQITSYVDTLNFYIVPVANPDGYEYSRSDVTPQTRFWRKNRGEQICSKNQWHRERCCGGVDLNRNFDFHWGETGSSTDVCSEIYQGSQPFSEPETRAIRDKLLSPEMFGKVDAFITLHTYSQMWIHPYNHQRRSFPSDVRDLEEVAKRAVKALEDVYGTKFRLGTGADILYPSAGGSDDWAKAKAGVKFVYLLELRPGEEEWDGFLLDRRQLIPTGRETWAGVRVVIDAIMRSQRSVAPGVTLGLDTDWSGEQGPRTIFLYSTPQFLIEHPYDSTTISSRPSSSTTPQSEEAFRVEHYRRLELLRLKQEKARRAFRRLQSRVCSDVSPWCANWIRNSPDVCRTSAIYMRQQCALSCRLC